jgi:exopolyphosphatase/guanosine-5'-triphosphate,3'-diphosphate pyrophosphatase
MSGGAAHLLQQTALALADGTVQLIVPESERIFLGESVQRRLETLAKALGRKPALVAASPPPPARGAARG